MHSHMHWKMIFVLCFITLLTVSVVTMQMQYVKAQLESGGSRAAAISP